MPYSLWVWFLSLFEDTPNSVKTWEEMSVNEMTERLDKPLLRSSSGGPNERRTKWWQGDLKRLRR